MKYILTTAIVFLFSICLIGCKFTEKSGSEFRQPNVVVILADDLGHGDISVYGQKNHLTPHKPKNEIQLFNLKSDPTESNDLVAKYPKKVEELWQTYKDFEETLKTNEAK